MKVEESEKKVKHKYESSFSNEYECDKDMRVNLDQSSDLKTKAVLMRQKNRAG